MVEVGSGGCWVREHIAKIGPAQRERDHGTFLTGWSRDPLLDPPVSLVAVK